MHIFIAMTEVYLLIIFITLTNDNTSALLSTTSPHTFVLLSTTSPRTFILLSTTFIVYNLYCLSANQRL